MDATTEAAWEACGRGICAANAGHEGTCAEASGWAESTFPGHVNAEDLRACDRHPVDATTEAVEAAARAEAERRYGHWPSETDDPSWSAFVAGATWQAAQEQPEPVCDPWAACPVHGDQHWREAMRRAPVQPAPEPQWLTEARENAPRGASFSYDLTPQPAPEADEREALAQRVEIHYRDYASAAARLETEDGDYALGRWEMAHDVAGVLAGIAKDIRRSQPAPRTVTEWGVRYAERDRDVEVENWHGDETGAREQLAELLDPDVSEHGPVLEAALVRREVTATEWVVEVSRGE